MTGIPSPPERIGFDRILDFPRLVGLLITASSIAAIAALDAYAYPRISLGMLYTVPMIFGSLFLNRFQVVALALVLALLREEFHPYSWDTDGITRAVYVMISYAAAGLFSGELVRNRRLVLAHYDALHREIRLRNEAELQLRTLIESSPAAIVMLEPSGCVDLANEAAHRLLGLEAGALPGRSIAEFIPMMTDLLSEQAAGNPYRAAAHCRGRRASGDSFLACIWFSTFQTPGGPRLAAIITDSSDDIRDLQESSLQSLLRSTRVLVGSVSHEIRNICAAIGVVHANLGRIPGIAGNEDFHALGTLSKGLAKLATLELQNTSDPEVDSVNVAELLEEFSVIEFPSIDAAEARLEIEVEPGLPLALGDHHGLLQVLLNLTRNSLRAMSASPVRRIAIHARRAGECIEITHEDSGPGISSSENLFKPFQSGVDSSGLGLFVSRAIVRAGGGEIIHEPGQAGCRMRIRLQAEPEDPAAFDIPGATSRVHGGTSMTRILHVDDHALFRESLSRLLAAESDFQVVAQCSTVDEALICLENSHLELILLDYELGDRRGSEVVAAARQKGIAGKILIVTVGLTRTEVRQMMSAGVAGIFLKNNSPEELIAAIKAVQRGETWLDPKYQQMLADAPSAETSRRVRFTERDRQVLRGVFEGMANKEIAERLHVSESAIKASLQQLFSKTGVRTRSQLVRVAIEHYRRELLS